MVSEWANMHPRTAITLSDAFTYRSHPRFDFRTDEGRSHAMGLAPYLAPLLQPGTRALDLGCSSGKSASVLCELGAHVTGIDVSLQALRFAQTVGRSVNAALALVTGDYAKLPFRDDSFDLALFPHNVVECSPEEFSQVLTESRRVLVPGGLFALSMRDWSEAGAFDRPVLKESTVTIPGQGTYPYPCYTWSVDAVRDAVAAVFTLQETKPMPHRKAGTWMVFGKG
jgi:SAM-dependent methyltransferase